MSELFTSPTASFSSSSPSPSSQNPLYRSALTFFVNKQFSHAIALLQPAIVAPQPPSSNQISIPIFIKLWNLYFAIINIAVKQSAPDYNPDENSISVSTLAPVNDSWPADRKNLALLVQSPDQLWKLVSDSTTTLFPAFQSANDSFQSTSDIPIETLIPLISLVSRHSDTLSTSANSQKPLLFLKTQVEHYLASLPEKEHALFYNDQDTLPNTHLTLESYYQLQIKLTEAYITKILFPLHEYDYAREFIPVNSLLSESTKFHLLESLETHKQEYTQRLESIEKAAKELRLKKELEKSLTKPDPPKPKSKPVPKPVKPASKHKHKKHRHPVKPVPQNTSLWASFNAWISLSKLLSLLGLILFIASLVRAKKLRSKIKHHVAAMLAKVAQTVKMGTKVSYV